MKYQLLVFFLIFYGLKVFSQIAEKKDSLHLFKAGYRSVFAIDSARTYKPGVSVSDKFYLRPVEMDIWYPAFGSKPKMPLLYGDFLKLLEQRSNRFQNDTVYKNLTTNLVHYLGFNLKVSDSAIVQVKTSSYLNAEAVQQPFPLVLYMSSYNGISYENIGLFEFLASHGYVVVCITSVGRYPGNMTTKTADLMEQVNDGYFAMHYLKNNPLVDSDKIGTMGYSWGGLAALLLTMKTKDIKTMLSLDGSEIHYYGDSREEDSDFNDLRNASYFKTDKINVPYAYMESGNKQNDRQVDSIFDILPMMGLNKFYIHFPKATHEDFSFLPSLNSISLGITDDSATVYRQVKEFALNFEDKYLKNKNSRLFQQLNFIYRHTGDSTYPVIKTDNRTSFVIKGKIVDPDKIGLAYVNIGISNKNLGTVSKETVVFQINIYQEFVSDSLTISMAGYQTRTIAISKLIHEPKPLSISLKEKFTELSEVVISQKTLPVKILGNTTTSNIISVGLPLKFLGSEVGVKINLGRNPVLLRKFSFNISGNRLDTAVFRMNIYNIKKSLPFENILHENIIIHVGKQTGCTR